MDNHATILMSVLTPTYNRALTLVRCYDRLEAQIYRLFEWIIVDDGSRDGTEALVLEFQNKASFPIYFVKKKNGGKLTTVNEFFRVYTYDCTNGLSRNLFSDRILRGRHFNLCEDLNHSFSSFLPIERNVNTNLGVTHIGGIYWKTTRELINDVDLICDEIAVSLAIGVSSAIRARLR